MKKKHINNYWKGKDTHNVPYCQSSAVGIEGPKCSETCYKFDTCTSDKKRNYIINKFTCVKNIDTSDISFIINDKVYTYKELSEILKKYEVEEDKKYNKCDKCGIKYLDNKLFNMIHENLEDDTELEPGTCIAYHGVPFITGIQITSKCGSGKKIKLCDNCIRELVLFLKGE